MAETLTRNPFQDFCAAYGCVWKKTAKFRLTMTGSEVYGRVDFAPDEDGNDAMVLRIPEQGRQREEHVVLTARQADNDLWAIGVAIDTGVFGIVGTWPDMAQVFNMKNLMMCRTVVRQMGLPQGERMVVMTELN